MCVQILRVSNPLALWVQINLLHSVAYNPFPTVLILNIASPLELIFSPIKSGHS